MCPLGAFVFCCPSSSRFRRIVFLEQFQLNVSGRRTACEYAIFSYQTSPQPHHALLVFFLFLLCPLFRKTLVSLQRNGIQERPDARDKCHAPCQSPRKSGKRRLLSPGSKQTGQEQGEEEEEVSSGTLATPMPYPLHIHLTHSLGLDFGVNPDRFSGLLVGVANGILKVDELAREFPPKRSNTPPEGVSIFGSRSPPPSHTLQTITLFRGSDAKRMSAVFFCDSRRKGMPLNARSITRGIDGSIDCEPRRCDGQRAFDFCLVQPTHSWSLLLRDGESKKYR